MDEFEKVTTGMGEECGVFGAYDMDGGDVAPSVYYGLFALQHRGQESCGIAVTDTNGERKVHSRKGLGLVNEVFDEESLAALKGNLGVGHVRYSTAGGTRAENAMPLVLNYVKGTLAIAHNGNLTNAVELRHELEYTGAIFQTTIDSEVIAYHIARERLRTKDVENAVKNAMKKIKGAYALVVGSPRKLCVSESAITRISWLQKAVPLPRWERNLSGMSGPERLSASPKRGSLQIFLWRSHRTDRPDVFLNISILPVWTV